MNSKEIKIASIKNRIRRIESRGTYIKSPGVLNALYRKLRRVSK